MNEKNSKSEESPTFKSGNGVIMAADAALAAAREVVIDATDDRWFRQRMMKAALETALASVIVL